MVGKIPQATDALVRTIGSCFGTPRVVVTQARPGWRLEDLLGDRVNVYLFQVTEDRLAANDMLPSRPELRPVTLSYLVTFYGRGAGGNAEAVIGRLARSAALDAAVEENGTIVPSGLVGSVSRTRLEEMALVWGMLRRRHALSIVVEVKGAVL